MTGFQWIRFLRHYGPVPRNDNMYDETIQRTARRQSISPITFEHPLQSTLLQCFDPAVADPVSAILTGTAGDGKTHLCRQVWTMLGGGSEEWASDSPYLSIDATYRPMESSGRSPPNPNSPRNVKIHFIRDLSGWAPQHGAAWVPDKEALLQRLCQSLFKPDTQEVFLIAANDGQLVESWRRLMGTESVERARRVFEDLLVENRQEQAGVRLKFFNLSRASSAELFDRALEAFLSHKGWEELRIDSAGQNVVFGPKCPIRHNYELLQTPLVRYRLRCLLELCDHNGLHVPIRQILLLLANSVLGHPDAKDHLMGPADVPKFVSAGLVSKASLYNNIFGGNLSETRRQTITIFDYLERFQIGFETSNRVDNLLIFGDEDDELGLQFDTFIARDEFYGGDERFYAARREYIEGNVEKEETALEFLNMLVAQRRGLFFKIPKDLESELRLWELTIFKCAGEYLEDVLAVLKAGGAIRRPIISKLIKGLNRVFTGMLINSDRELHLATSGNFSQSKVSAILLERVSVDPRRGEKVVIRHDASTGRLLLEVFFTPTLCVQFELTLIRYEFLSRIALEGALPASFSKECYEDLLAFKSQLIAAFLDRQSSEPAPPESTVSMTLLSLTDQGTPEPRSIEISL